MQIIVAIPKIPEIGRIIAQREMRIHIITIPSCYFFEDLRIFGLNLHDNLGPGSIPVLHHRIGFHKTNVLRQSNRIFYFQTKEIGCRKLPVPITAYHQRIAPDKRSDKTFQLLLVKEIGIRTGLPFHPLVISVFRPLPPFQATNIGILVSRSQPLVLTELLSAGVANILPARIAQEIPSVYIVYIPIAVIIDSISRNFSGIMPYASLQFRMRKIKPTVNDSYND